MIYDTKYVPRLNIWPANSKYTIKKFVGAKPKGSTLKEGAALCLKYHLYVRGWLLSKWMQQVLENKVSRRLSIYIIFRDTIPIGIVFVRKQTAVARKRKHIPVDVSVSIYVKPTERRKGHGTSLMNEVIKDHGKRFIWSTGIIASRKFFDTLEEPSAQQH